MYAFTILTVSTLSVAAEIIENMRNSAKIREMARYTCPITVRLPDKDGNSTLIEVDSSELLPGDVVVVPESKCLPCDIVLLTGSAIVNEAMLTGESIPVMKTSLPHTDTKRYSTSSSAKHTLFGGTLVVQSRSHLANEPVFGLVTSTGFLTTKGSLVRDILYPREIKFKFYQDGMKFVAIMALISIIGFCCTLPIMIKNGTSLVNLIDRSLDLITITVPPALPAAMTCGVVFAI